jgi:hypothetical protein
MTVKKIAMTDRTILLFFNVDYYLTKFVTILSIKPI